MGPSLFPNFGRSYVCRLEPPRVYHQASFLKPESANKALGWFDAWPPITPWSQQLTQTEYAHNYCSCAAWVINLLWGAAVAVPWIQTSIQYCCQTRRRANKALIQTNLEFITFTLYTLLRCPQ